MINFNPAMPTYNNTPKQNQSVKIKGYSGKKLTPTHMIERRKISDRRQARQEKQKFDRRQVADRRRPKIDLSI